jgi:class 3 adenylate cyclase
MAALIEVTFSSDVRDVLASIRVPTLVLHRDKDSFAPVEHGRYLAEHIEGVRLVELRGIDHPHVVGDTDAVIDEVEEFVTGTRSISEADRVLATVMFTDIAGSTEVAARLGDRAWRALLERHDALVRHEPARFRGTEIKTIGDGFLATFDGPARAVRCAKAIIEGVAALGMQLRVGLHTGEVEVHDGDNGGIGVHVGARVAGLACGGEVLASSTVKDLVVGSGWASRIEGSTSSRACPATGACTRS